MARKKSAEVALSIAPKLGDSVRVITPTIFDNARKLSDLLITGTVTKVNPEPGWDYEVTFNGTLSLDGRGDIKTRFYNIHQISKMANNKMQMEVPKEMGRGIYDVIMDTARAADYYNHIIRQINEIDKRIQNSLSNTNALIGLCYDRDCLMTKLPQALEQVNTSRAALAAELRALFAEHCETT